MAFDLTDLAGLKTAGFDTIIDVRSPSEFAEDRVPGAVNYPVLSDEERAKVGTIYTQESPFTARKFGAALVARNAATTIETHLMEMSGGWRPLVYCWRGGQRSGSFASILAQIGWRVEVLAGGYQSWRRHVVARLYESSLENRMIRLDGYTGTGKTEILRRVAQRGGQMLDLEGLANHRGSILGDVCGAQPSQKGFESSLLAAIDALDPNRPVVVEAESSRIGDIRLPPSLWAAMKDSPRIVIDAPLPVRARYLAAAYADLSADVPRLTERLQGLRKHVGHDRLAHWLDLLERGKMEALATTLMADHYDTSYSRMRKAEERPVVAQIALDGLTSADMDAAADRIMARL